MTKKTTTEQLDHVEASLRRWHTRLTRASNEVRKLEKKRRRLLAQVPRKQGRPTKPVEVDVIVTRKVPDTIPLPELDAFFQKGLAAQKAIDDLTIPPQFRRTMEDRNIDQLAERTEALPEGSLKKSQQERLKRMDEKRRGRSMFNKSDMPLTGKDALKAIRAKKTG